MKIGYLGPPGSYSHAAAVNYVAGLAGEAEYLSLPSFAAVIDSVESRCAELGVLPVENSTYGAVPAVVDMLTAMQNGRICGELVLDVGHCLIGSGAAADIECIFSHEQALAQCRGFLDRKYPAVRLVPCASTSQACLRARQAGKTCAAVAARFAAAVYKLKVLSENIQDNAYNQTRFLLIGRDAPAPSGADKTSLAFALRDDAPGGLFSVLAVFAESQINLTHIESRPAKYIMGKYIFYIDFSGHVAAKSVQAAVAAVRSRVSWLKVLGSYPAAVPE